MQDIERLFIEVKAIREKYELLAKITGENFNVFQILGLQSSEVRLHSSFIAELLNIQGSHDQGDKFLSLFLSQLGITEFTAPLSKTHVEFFTSKITDDGENGGRIDILLEDVKHRRIIIENKVYAGDQSKQLKRYKNFDKYAVLLYLNLFGNEPSEESSYGLKKDIDFSIISYEKQILPWLESCLKESATLPIIRETIHQYINLIKSLTNQSVFKTMNTEIIKLFCIEPEYFKTVPSILSAYNGLRTGIYNQFFETLEQQLNEKGFEINIENTDLKIQLQAGEDGAGFYFAYRIVKRDNNLRCNIVEKLNRSKQQHPIIRNNPKNELFESFSKIIKYNIVESQSSDWSLAYYNADEFKRELKLDQIDVKLYLSLYNREECNAFIKKLLEKEMISFEKIKNEINKFKV